MKKMLLVSMMLSTLFLLGCPDTPEVPSYSTEPSEKYEITYLLTEFEANGNKNAETIWQQEFNNQSPAKGGYFYTYDDPSGTLDDIFPWAAESDHCSVCDPAEIDGSDPEKGQCCITPGDVELFDCTIGGFAIKPPGCAVQRGIDVNNDNPFTYFGSSHSMHIKGTTAGQGVGFGIYFMDDVDAQLAGKVGAKEPRALGDNKQEGIVFWATGNASIQVALSMPEVTPISDGGLCDEGAGEKCFDYHFVQFDLDGAWREYHAAWSDFQQEGWGIPVALDPNEFINIQFKVVPPQSGAEDFDIWLDHLGFYGGDTWDFVLTMADTDAVGPDTSPTPPRIPGGGDDTDSIDDTDDDTETGSLDDTDDTETGSLDDTDDTESALDTDTDTQ